METETAPSFPEEALQQVLSFISSHKDRNSVSLVCKSWYDIERWCRRHVFIGNSYAVSPPMLVRRFTHVRSIIIKGKHVCADFDFLPQGWGAHALPWIAHLAAAYPAMEEIRFKRMVLTDHCLDLIARKLLNLRVLVLLKCDGFSTHGLASIAANCRNLRMLDLCESEEDDLGGDWISKFPDSYTSLEFLNVDRLKSELHFSSLERLVSRCPNLKSLRVNASFPLEKLVNLVLKAPQLVDLGIGLFTMETCPEAFTKLADAIAGCKGLKRLSGLYDANSYYLPTIYPVCSGLTSLNLTHSNLRCPDLIQLLHNSPNLQRLWVSCNSPSLQTLYMLDIFVENNKLKLDQTRQVLDYIEDRGLEEVAASCKELRELRVLLSDPNDADPNMRLTERGLVCVSIGCGKLNYIQYSCNQMTNAALLTIAKHKPNLTCLRLMISEPQLPDHLTHEPLDIGFSAIIESCKSLKRLIVTGLVTDRLLEHIGMHGKKLEVLSLAFGGNSDMGLHHVISGCHNLRKFIARDCPFGARALLANSDRLDRMRSLWMYFCSLSLQECKLLGLKNPRLNVEVINENGSLHPMSDECHVENLYVYRSVAGPRSDMSEFVWSTNQKESLGQLHLDKIG